MGLTTPPYYGGKVIKVIKSLYRQINITKGDTFFYHPTWDSPLIQVMEADYKGNRSLYRQINTMKVDTFFYDPTWDLPLIQVMEADYKGNRSFYRQINTTKVDTFFYDPTWDSPLVQVLEADYKGIKRSYRLCYGSGRILTFSVGSGSGRLIMTEQYQVR
jgi:hypothetical protein